MRIKTSGVVEAEDLLRGVAERMGDLSRVMQVAAEDTKALIDDAFDQSRSPDGTKWQALSETTAAIRASLAVQKARFGVAKRASKKGEDVSQEALDKARKRALSAAEKKEKGRKPLVDTARLRNSISARAHKTGFAFGTNVVYAAAQHFGNPKNKVFGRARGPIPARPFFPIASDGSRFELMTTGPAGRHWSNVRRMVATYIRTGRIT